MNARVRPSGKREGTKRRLKAQRTSGPFEQAAGTWMMIRPLVVGACAIALGLSSYATEARAALGSARPAGTIIAGPVLNGTRAFWSEAEADKLSLRSLNPVGHLATVWSHADSPGVPAGVIPELSVPSISAGSGRIAFIRTARQPSAGSAVTLPASSTLFAGRPGRIRALRTIEGICHHGLAPVAVAVSSVGLLSYEETSPCERFGSKLLLRSFGGRRLLTLQSFESGRGIYALSAAGRWAAWLEETRQGGVLHVFNLRSDTSALQQATPPYTRTVAIDAQGNFAIATGAGLSSCQSSGHQPTFAIRSASVRRPRLRMRVRRAASPYFAIFDGSVAFTTATAACPPSFGAALLRNNGSVLRFPRLQGFTGPQGITYDGQALSLADTERVGLGIIRAQFPARPTRQPSAACSGGQGRAASDPARGWDQFGISCRTAQTNLAL